MLSGQRPKRDIQFCKILQDYSKARRRDFKTELISFNLHLFYLCHPLENIYDFFFLNPLRMVFNKILS